MAFCKSLESKNTMILHCKFSNTTRMHSSRMRTGRTLTLFRSLLFPGGGLPAQGGCTCQGGVYLPGGCTCPGEGVPARGVYLPRGECTCQGDVPATCQGGVLAQGVPAWEGGVPAWGVVDLPGGAWSGTPPVNRMNDRQV